ncbi:MAG: TlpA disulfide reductase family protein [Terracidiphilus sp.]|jgi:thiol-disulfide isomerase/thioredoxin
MNRLYRYLLPFFLISVSAAQGITGRWDGNAKIGDTLTIPVHLELSGDKNLASGAFINGTQRTSATEGEFEGNSLTLKFAQFATTLKATLTNGILQGTYSNDSGDFSYPLELAPHVNQDASDEKAPNISGVWIIPTESSKGEHAWRLVVSQKGSNVSATILRVDGDTGTLTGTYRNGKFTITHFGDVRASILEIVPASDGSLDLALDGTHTHAGLVGDPAKFKAIRATDSRAKVIPPPDDFSAHTSVKDPRQPFHFSFPDLNGKIVSNTDQQFANKVVLVNVTGSWCPNCHDEAPYLAELYRKYHSRGLEIVALDFEESSQAHTLARLHAFIKKYGIEYTYLLAGEPADVHDKLSQAANLNAWPTTFFIGRDGLVHAIETGFPSSGSLVFDHEVKQKYEVNIEKLLQENKHAFSSSKPQTQQLAN